MAAKIQAVGIEPCKKSRVIDGDFEAGLACAALTKAKRKRNLLNRVDAAAYKNFEQQLEPCRLKRNSFNAFPANKKEARHRILGACSVALNGPGDPNGSGRDQL